MYCTLSPKSLFFLSAESSVWHGRPRLAILWASEVQVTLEGHPNAFSLLLADVF